MSDMVGMYYTATNNPSPMAQNLCLTCFSKEAASLVPGTPPHSLGYDKVLPRSNNALRAWSDSSSDFTSTRDSFSSLDDEYQGPQGLGPAALAGELLPPSVLGSPGQAQTPSCPASPASAGSRPVQFGAQPAAGSPSFSSGTVGDAPVTNCSAGGTRGPSQPATDAPQSASAGLNDRQDFAQVPRMPYAGISRRGVTMRGTGVASFPMDKLFAPPAAAGAAPDASGASNPAGPTAPGMPGALNSGGVITRRGVTMRGTGTATFPMDTFWDRQPARPVPETPDLAAPASDAQLAHVEAGGSARSGRSSGGVSVQDSVSSITHNDGKARDPSASPTKPAPETSKSVHSRGTATTAAADSTCNGNAQPTPAPLSTPAAAPAPAAAARTVASEVPPPFLTAAMDTAAMDAVFRDCFGFVSPVQPLALMDPLVVQLCNCSNDTPEIQRQVRCSGACGRKT